MLPGCTFSLIGAVIFAALLSFPANSQSTPPEPVPGTIEVRGKREIDREIIADNLEELTARVPLLDVMPCYFKPLCLHVIGPEPKANRMIARRIIEAATVAGLKTPRRNCNENAIVIIVDEPERLFETLVKRRHWIVSDMGRDASLDRLRDELGSGKPAISWSRTNFVKGGVDFVMQPGDAPFLRHPRPSRVPGNI